jgi:hypothetical protein
MIFLLVFLLFAVLAVLDGMASRRTGHSAWDYDGHGKLRK